MQEIFDTKLVLKNAINLGEKRLYNAILTILKEMQEEAKFFYNINPEKSLILKYNNITEISGFDCIFAPLILHKTNNIENFIAKIHSELPKNGIFLGNFFGLSNLLELGKLLSEEDTKIIGQPMQRMLPLIEIKTAGNILQKAGFKNVVVANQEITFNFLNLREALYFLKKSGEGNCLMLRDKTFLAGNLLKKYIESFQNPITLSFDVCFFSCLKG